MMAEAQKLCKAGGNSAGVGVQLYLSLSPVITRGLDLPEAGDNER